jgi:hypothetical protein
VGCCCWAWALAPRKDDVAARTKTGRRTRRIRVRMQQSLQQIGCSRARGDGRKGWGWAAGIDGGYRITAAKLVGLTCAADRT